MPTNTSANKDKAKLKGKPVDATAAYTEPVAPTPLTPNDNFREVRTLVQMGDLNRARDFLGTLPKEERAAIKVYIALNLQVTL